MGDTGGGISCYVYVPYFTYRSAVVIEAVCWRHREQASPSPKNVDPDALTFAGKSSHSLPVESRKKEPRRKNSTNSQPHRSNKLRNAMNRLQSFDRSEMGSSVSGWSDEMGAGADQLFLVSTYTDFERLGEFNRIQSECEW